MFAFLKKLFSFNQKSKKTIDDFQISEEALANKKLQLFTTRNEDEEVVVMRIVDFNEAKGLLKNFLSKNSFVSSAEIKDEDFVFGLQSPDEYYIQFVKKEVRGSLVLDFVGIETEGFFQEINATNQNINYWIEVLKKFWIIEDVRSF